MTNTMELELLLKKKGISKRKLAEELNITEQGLHKKINNITEFKASEIQIISSLLGIDRGSDIFFASNVN